MPAPWELPRQIPSPPPGKDSMQNHPSGGKFFMQIPLDAQGGVVMEKIDSCIIKVIA